MLVNAGTCQGLVRETDALLNFHGEEDLFQYLQQQIYPSYYGLPLAERLKVAYSMTSTWPQGASLSKLALTQGQFNNKSANHVGNGNITPLHHAAFQLTRYCCMIQNKNRVSGRDDVNDSNNPWRRLIKDLVSAGASLHAIDDSKRSILSTIIQGTWAFFSSIKLAEKLKTSNKRFALISQILNIWLSDLQEVGVDLVRYAVDEKVLHLAGAVNRSFLRYHPQRCYMSTYLINFSYGPCPEDWHFYFSEPTDVFAGEFWAMAESFPCQDELELRIPGSWIECL